MTIYYLWGYIYLYNLVYFVRINGSCPISEWLDSQEVKVSAGFLAKFRMLEVEGLKLLNTNVIKHIVGQSHLYEIRYGRYRIITFFDERINSFVLLNGFRKQKMNEQREIQRGIKLKEEYLKTPL